MPPGPNVDLDYKRIRLSVVLDVLRKVGGVTVVLPEGIDPEITIHAKNIPSKTAIQAVLESEGLWFRDRHDHAGLPAPKASRVLA